MSAQLLTDETPAPETPKVRLVPCPRLSRARLSPSSRVPGLRDGSVAHTRSRVSQPIIKSADMADEVRLPSWTPRAEPCRREPWR